MACLEMYNQNSEQHKVPPPPSSISPRISFSNDFLESSSNPHSHPSHKQRYRDAPVSSDFEFSVSNNSMMSADELFFKGRLLPFKETCSSGSCTNSFQKSTTTTTLRDELQNQENDEDNNIFSLRPPKNPTRWKGFLGLRKSHIGSKKSDKHPEGFRLGFHQDDAQCIKNSEGSVE